MGTLVMLFIAGYIVSRFLKKHNRKSRKAMKKQVKKSLTSKASKGAVRAYHSFSERRNAKQNGSSTIIQPTYSNRLQNIFHDEYLNDGMMESDDNPRAFKPEVNRPRFVEGVGEVRETPVRYLPLSPWGGTETPEEYK